MISFIKSSQVDVSQHGEVVELYANVKRDLGTVDILVNNAGIVPLMSLQERPPEDIERIMNVNVMSHFWVSVHFKSLSCPLPPQTLIDERAPFVRR